MQAVIMERDNSD